MNNMSRDGCSQTQQAASAATSSLKPSRWKSTDKQANMLKDLYKQGIRNPSPEQIQHITSKLKVYGHIEGKNVFCWFQNNQANERQKQNTTKKRLFKKKKQETNLFKRFIHKPSSVVNPPFLIPISRPPPPPPPYNNNVICNQLYTSPTPSSSQANIGYYHQYPISNKVPIPTVGVVKRRLSSTGVMMERKLECCSACGAGFYPAHYNRMVQQTDAMQGLVVGVREGLVNEDSNTNTPPTLPFKKSSSRDTSQTLQLFPFLLTEVLDDRSSSTK